MLQGGQGAEGERGEGERDGGMERRREGGGGGEREEREERGRGDAFGGKFFRFF